MEVIHHIKGKLIILSLSDYCACAVVIQREESPLAAVRPSCEPSAAVSADIPLAAAGTNQVFPEHMIAVSYSTLGLRCRRGRSTWS